MWSEITYPFSQVNGAAVEDWEWINNSPHFYYWDYLSMMRLSLTHVSKRAPAMQYLFLYLLWRKCCDLAARGLVNIERFTLCKYHWIENKSYREWLDAQQAALSRSSGKLHWFMYALPCPKWERVRSRKSNPYCSPAPSYIVTTNPYRSGLITL